MTKWTVRCVVLCAWFLASASLYAHHSLAGVYTLGKEAKVTGAFKAFRLVNPHSSMKLDVKNADGTTIEWSIVGGSVTSHREARDRQRTDRMPSTPGMKSPSRSCRRRTARVRLGFWSRSPTRTGTRSVSGRPMSRRGIASFHP